MSSVLSTSLHEAILIKNCQRVLDVASVQERSTLKKMRHYTEFVLAGQLPIVCLVLLASLVIVPGTARACIPLGLDRLLICNDGSVLEEKSAIAYNSQDQEYLVIWQAAEVWGEAAPRQVVVIQSDGGSPSVRTMVFGGTMETRDVVCVTSQ